MSTKPNHGMIFRELKPEQLQSGRLKVGLKEWQEMDDK